MNEISYKNSNTTSDRKLSEDIGDFIKHHRVDQNKTQNELSKAAGISRSTLSLLERGETVTLATLIQVLRVLDKLNVLEGFSVEQTLSPLALAKLEKKKRQRVRKGKGENGGESNW